ncbi:rhodanese-like domain-containing protein [Bowmanella yangjiangensis]|uniref:Rhodanese-like domain-containing protein n=1 Tax=Bowmanella yangjiangensis TaxID=2811230 RepID=A0ABS3D1H2_9ALTE|nr:rhodanese-like domain-containing protein [Bowmanella yangjiangensis]MBN7823219.1 rhodanese-like domain-containing protein [Bowmanella yangjiangensis]
MRLAILFLTGLFTLAGAHAAEVDQAAALETLQDEDSLLIDVRSAEEFADGALPGAINLEHDRIAERIASVAPDKDRPLVLYCRSGRRSSFAQDKLQALGYSRVVNAGAYDDLLPLLERDE